MNCVLGSIEFELFSSPIGDRETSSFNFAVHDVIDPNPLAAPVLQAIGQNLPERALSMRFHSSVCNPDQRYQDLLALARAMDSNALFYGDHYEGMWVITQIAGTTIQRFPSNGAIMAIDVEVQLKEAIFPRGLRRGVLTGILGDGL